MKTLKEWMKANLDSYDLKGIIDQGCAAYAPPGLIYYHESMALYDKYSDEIWDWLNDESDRQGLDRTIDLIAQFRGTMSCREHFENQLVWMYVEANAQEVLDEVARVVHKQKEV